MKYYSKSKIERFEETENELKNKTNENNENIKKIHENKFLALKNENININETIINYRKNNSNNIKKKKKKIPAI